MIRTFTQVMPSPPVSQPKTIETLLETLGERVELHPVYQRDIKWSQENMCELIKTVMENGFIPGILLYALQRADERAKDSYRTECVDGQHRFFTFHHFFNSKPVELPGKKPFLIYLPYSEGGRTVHVFYNRTAHTVAWEAENRDKRADYMTDEEKDHFNNFLLDIREIRSPLTLDQRRRLFLSLQKGIPVRGSDFYKNMTDVPLVKFISEEKRWEGETKQLMTDHLSINPKQYWLHWLVRAYLIKQAQSVDAIVAAFMLKDSLISNMIKKEGPLLEAKSESLAAFNTSITRFFAFLQNLPAGVKLTPTQFYAVFTHLLDAPDGREEIIVSHMKDWSTEGMTSKQRKMWENRGFEEEERRDWFKRSLDEIKRIRIPAAEVGARKNIPKKIRDRLWIKYFGSSQEGICVCCKGQISQNNWECAHVIAHKCGGSDGEDNLRPTCRSCNREMGTENLDLFRIRCFPSKSE